MEAVSDQYLKGDGGLLQIQLGRIHMGRGKALFIIARDGMMLCATEHTAPRFLQTLRRISKTSATGPHTEEAQDPLRRIGHDSFLFRGFFALTWDMDGIRPCMAPQSKIQAKFWLGEYLSGGLSNNRREPRL
ncbi:MAG: hypothetical protein Q9170_006031 [Blastenia crenularia]